MQKFYFTVRVVDDAERDTFGVFTKRVDARNLSSAWVHLAREVRKLDVVQLTLEKQMRP